MKNILVVLALVLSGPAFARTHFVCMTEDQSTVVAVSKVSVTAPEETDIVVYSNKRDSLIQLQGTDKFNFKVWEDFFEDELDVVVTRKESETPMMKMSLFLLDLEIPKDGDKEAISLKRAKINCKF